MKKYLLCIGIILLTLTSSVNSNQTGIKRDYYNQYATPTTINPNLKQINWNPTLPQSGQSIILAAKRARYLDVNLLLDNKEVMCMAKNIFFEAAVESTAGKLAVAQVTLNRVKSKRYPNNVCDVVYEGAHYRGSNGTLYPVRDRCQFSWYCDGKGDEPKEGKLWRSAYDLAKYVILWQEDLPDITDGATHYHANYIDRPSWTKRKKITASIDQHIFYKKNMKYNF